MLYRLLCYKRRSELSLTDLSNRSTCLFNVYPLTLKLRAFTILTISCKPTGIFPILEVTTKKDEFDYYYEIKRKNQDITKFYCDLNTAKIDFNLYKIEDLHIWIKYFKQFLKRWKFTDITLPIQDIELSIEEDYIIKEAIYTSIDNHLKKFVDNEKTAIGIYDMLKTRYKYTYTPSVKNHMWKSILIDAFCSDINSLDNDLNSLVAIENYTLDNGKSPTVDNEFINRKIKKCLHNSLDGPVELLINADSLTVKNIDISPIKYIEYICNTIRCIRDRNDIYNIEIKLCNNCQSAFHSVRNCKFGSYLRQPETRSYDNRSKESGKTT
ncbi:Tkp4 protein [Vanderwaltozyma polyspora DSM 70294]|uniref:Tkp4 protein n=1 Tax=Vanderwaltozyma polyspora (strain ATCC 22028 / DSM 70294 / BCRC 21397 / CBS 2163 / NBRC 10782 / NRRL Y-8283 / UCD 57-17) TaxID=436907 RepID=A7TKG8_VANPO|nr:Tkp4 protein [Vanderwaltozyma polyspora DSM 70294]EDO17190.1 Tkp4 protein [Vanderwaltozyma polyspora DSM 70294]